MGYVVIGIFAALAGLIFWSSRKRWRRRRGDAEHNPLHGHRLEGSDHTGGGGSFD